MKRSARPLVLAVAALSMHCGGEASAPPPVATPTPLLPEAGFLDVPPRDVVLKGQPVHIAAAARLFYNFRPADESPRDKPIFIAFNGFAAEIVRAYGTGPTTVAEGGAVVDNPSSLTQIANLVYIDPRQAGFSYDVIAGRAPVASDCASAIFNEYVDAADTLLAALRFLDEHPELQGPVYWFGESYAGVRVQWILAYLRGRWDLAGYQDPALAAAIAGAQRAASLRAGQILLQPWLAGKAHADAIAAACLDPAVTSALSASLGTPCVSESACACADANERSRYNFVFTRAQQQQRDAEASLAHIVPERAALLFGVPLSAIPRLAPSARADGFKCSPPDADVPKEDAIVAALGPLPAGQSYYAPYSPLFPGKSAEIPPPKMDWAEENFVGLAFVDNLRDVPAFVTDGRRDLVVPLRALAPALSALVGADRVSLLSPPRLRVGYPDGERIIDVGTYPEAGHMITMLSPEAFSADVRRWIAAR